MSLSKEVLENIANAKKMGLDKVADAPPAETREQMKKAPANPNPTQVGKVLNETVPEGEVPIRIYIPEGEGPFAMIAYFHGGGFVLMSIESHDEICRQLCAKTGCLVMSVEYPLAPEHPYPAGINGSMAAIKWLIENSAVYKGISDRLAVAGDSAGGYMALFSAQKLHGEGISLKAQFAAYPVTDHYSAHHPSWEENKDGYVMTAKIMKWFWDNYLTEPAKYGEASPLRTANFSGLPPAMIFTANYDPLRDEGKAYVDKLMVAGIETTYKNYENIHGFLVLEKWVRKH